MDFNNPIKNFGNQLGSSPFFDYSSVFGTPNTPSWNPNPNLNPSTWSTYPTTGGGNTNSTAQTVTNAVTNQLRFDQIMALISQGLTAFGKNPSTQVSGYTVQTVQQPQQQYVPYGASGLSPSGGLTLEQQAALEAIRRNSAGGALGSGLDGIVNWATQNPLYVFGGIAALYLLMREPPRAGRR